MTRALTFDLNHFKRLDMTKLGEASLILLAGAIGGIVSTIDSWQASLAIASTATALASVAVIPAFKGAVAAGVGVYLLTTVDSAQFIRSFFFAVTCGLAFPSILTNGTSYAARVTATVASGELTKAVETIREVAPTTAGSPASAAPTTAITKLSETAVAAIQVTPKIPLEDVKTADNAATQAIGAIATSPSAATVPAAVKAIGDIGVAAAVQNLPASRDAALTELRGLATRQGVAPSVAQAASTAVKRIELINPRNAMISK